MNRIKLLTVLTGLGFIAYSLPAYADSNPNQTITGQVTASGTFSAELEKEEGVTPGLEVSDKTGPWGDCNIFTYENNKLFVTWNGCDGEDYNDDLDGKRAYIVVTFDKDLNVIDTKYGSVRGIGYGTGNANFCEGDSNACKFMSWAHVSIKSPRTLTCGFTCDHKDIYNYNVKYEVDKSGTYQTLDTKNTYKCEAVRDIFSPNSEWFGTLTHSCAYAGGSKLFTVDTISPPTNLSACTDQTNCLSGATEYSLTSNTFGRGIEKIPADFINQVQNSLSPGTDTSLRCSGGKCTPYASGAKKLTVSVPEHPYYGQCRGTATSETVEGKTITAPEVQINTAEAKIPALTSTLDFNVINRPPVVSVSFARDPIAPNEAVQVTCDIVDPDDCVDKIVKVKWSCFNDQGQQVNCFFLDKNGIWKPNSITEEIPENIATNPYRAITSFKGTQVGGYAVTCEASDNDANVSSTGYSVAGVAVCSDCVGQVSAKMKFCAVLSDDGASKTVCDDSAKVTYNAYQSGLEPDQYEWKCSENEAAQLGGITKECNYSSEGTYNPVLRIHDKTSNEWVTCANQAKTKVTKNSSCIVGLRKTDSTDDYSSSIQVAAGEEVEAKLSRECLTKGDISWTVNNGTKLSENKDNETIKLKFTSAGTGTVQAVTQNITCGQAQATVKDKIQFGE